MEDLEADLSVVSGAVQELDVPVLIPGDIFDRWNAPPEAVNLAIRCLPKGCYAIPGQHDLPYHRYEDRKRSAYWTLVEAGTLIDLSPDQENRVEFRPSGHPLPVPLSLWAFPWGHGVESNPHHGTKGLHVALVHAYLWSSDADRHPQADAKDQALARWQARCWDGYHVCLYGDNHVTWVERFRGRGGPERLTVVNHGSLSNRTIDQKGRTRYASVILSDGSVKMVGFADNGHWLDGPSVPTTEREADFSQVVEEVRGMGDHGIDFLQEVRHALRTVPEKVAAEVIRALEAKGVVSKGFR